MTSVQTLKGQGQRCLRWHRPHETFRLPWKATWPSCAREDPSHVGAWSICALNFFRPFISTLLRDVCCHVPIPARFSHHGRSHIWTYCLASIDTVSHSRMTEAQWRHPHRC